VDEHHPRRVRIIGEPIFTGRTPDEIGPCVQHEALINVAFAGVDTAILCPYDVAQLPSIVDYAEHTHPVVVERDGRRRPGDYRLPTEVVDLHNRPLPEPDAVDEALVFDVPRLGALRRAGGPARQRGRTAARAGRRRPGRGERGRHQRAHPRRSRHRHPARMVRPGPGGVRDPRRRDDRGPDGRPDRAAGRRPVRPRPPGRQPPVRSHPDAHPALRTVTRLHLRRAA
jgi:hypothetical protein